MKPPPHSGECRRNRFLIEPTNHALLTAVLHIAPAEIDADRIYVIGDSMGAYGAWDTVGRGAIPFAVAIAACGSGPSNRIEQILATPFWAIHGAVDATVPNFLPRTGDVDGAGSLGMLQPIDPAFDNHGSTGIVRVDQYATAADDPSPSDMLIEPLAASPYPLVPALQAQFFRLRGSRSH